MTTAIDFMKKQSSDISQFHQEQLVHIGKVLQASREALSLSFGELSSKTLIRADLLNAIETADVSQLPEPVYTRGLIRRYGDALGLDGEALALQYFTPPDQAPQSRSFWRVRLTPQLRPIHLYFSYVLLIGMAITGLSYTLQRMSYRSSTLPVLEGQVAEEATLPQEGVKTSAAEDKKAAATDKTPTLPPEIANSPIRVSVQLQEQSWLRITADGTVAFEGILKEGDAEVWTAKKQLTIRAGNAGGVLVSFNEGPARLLGQPGAVAESTYPPEGTAQLP